MKRRIKLIAAILIVLSVACTMSSPKIESSDSIKKQQFMEIKASDGWTIYCQIITIDSIQYIICDKRTQGISIAKHRDLRTKRQ